MNVESSNLCTEKHDWIILEQTEDHKKERCLTCDRYRVTLKSKQRKLTEAEEYDRLIQIISQVNCIMKCKICDFEGHTNNARRIVSHIWETGHRSYIPIV